MSDRRQSAKVDYIQIQNCVEVTCNQSNDTEQAWGNSEASVKRALAELTENCSCGADWHYDEDED